MRPNYGFRAMGVDVLVGGASELQAAAVRRLFEQWDGVFSRFRPDSELSRVNRTKAEAIVVSPLFAYATASALDAAGSTGGLVDPTLGVAIEAAGYDRDFARLVEDERPVDPTAPGQWRSLRLDGRLLWRPAGTKLDLNGVVKALAVDAAAALVAGEGFVSAGGDVATRGATVVGLPAGGSLRLLDGGIATSGTAERRWRRGGAVQHHLIDPRTGRPAVSRWTHVTVAAESCLNADIAAKAALLLSDDGPAWLDEQKLPGRFVSSAETIANAPWREAMEERPKAAA